MKMSAERRTRPSQRTEGRATFWQREQTWETDGSAMVGRAGLLCHSHHAPRVERVDTSAGRPESQSGRRRRLRRARPSMRASTLV